MKGTIEGVLVEHQKVLHFLHAMASSDLDSDITPNSTPEGQWVIPLQCKVRREVSSYSMEKIKSDTARILFLKFTAYQKTINCF